MIFGLITGCIIGLIWLILVGIPTSYACLRFGLGKFSLLAANSLLFAAWGAIFCFILKPALQVPINTSASIIIGTALLGAIGVSHISLSDRT